jgi:hypothetical protein
MKIVKSFDKEIVKTNLNNDIIETFCPICVGK